MSGYGRVSARSFLHSGIKTKRADVLSMTMTLTTMNFSAAAADWVHLPVVP